MLTAEASQPSRTSLKVISFFPRTWIVRAGLARRRKRNQKSSIGSGRHRRVVVVPARRTRISSPGEAVPQQFACPLLGPCGRRRSPRGERRRAQTPSKSRASQHRPPHRPRQLPCIRCSAFRAGKVAREKDARPAPRGAIAAMYVKPRSTPQPRASSGRRWTCACSR